MSTSTPTPVIQEPALGAVRMVPPVRKPLPRESIPAEFVQWWKTATEEKHYFLLHGGVSPLIEAFNRGRDVGQSDASQQLEQLSDALYRVLPYLEDAQDDAAYKKGAVKSVIKLVTDALRKPR